MPKRALILDLQNRCNLWLMRSAVEPGPEILRFTLEELENNILASMLELLREISPANLHTAVMEITNTLKLADPEATESPWWTIIDPRQNFFTNEEGLHRVANMITGPYFSRADAEAHLKGRAHAFSKNARVYCHSGYYSYKYKMLNRAIAKEARDKPENIPAKV